MLHSLDWSRGSQETWVLVPVQPLHHYVDLSNLRGGGLFLAPSPRTCLPLTSPFASPPPQNVDHGAFAPICHTQGTALGGSQWLSSLTSTLQLRRKTLLMYHHLHSPSAAVQNPDPSPSECAPCHHPRTWIPGSAVASSQLLTYPCIMRREHVTQALLWAGAPSQCLDSG